MRIVFYDRTPVDYTAETPFVAPLGGSESAQCYLSIELAKLGHTVALVSNTSAPGRYRGVACSNHRDPGTPALLNAADIVVSSNEALGRFIRDHLRVTRPLVIWIQHAHDQPAVRGLESSRERKIWAGYAFVSDWQLRCYVDAFWVPEERSRVLRNAIAPPFAEVTPADPWYLNGEPPRLAYTSQPYRGLDVLLDAFPAIAAAIPGTRLRVFSGFAATYGTPLADDPYAELYLRCRAVAGIDYRGPVPQPELMRELRSAAALAYPSTFAETSCISVLEAMAAGAAVLSTKLGALPETAGGFAWMTEYLPGRAALARAFAAMAIEALNEMRRDPEAALARRAAQIAYVREKYTWPVRALEWQAWLSDIVARHAP